MIAKRPRRKLGRLIQNPIDEFIQFPSYDRLIFVEQDKAAAQRTRAAALMYIGRNDMGLTTSVKENEIWVLKNKDIMDESMIVDLRV